MTENLINALAISGAAGTGKTTIANQIGRLTGWTVVGAGGDFRAIRGDQADIGASTGTDQQHDSIDYRMLLAMIEGRSIAEGRVAAVIAYKNNLKNTKRVLLVCDEELSALRIWQRDGGKLYTSLKEARIVTSEREADNLRVFTDRLQLSYLDPSFYDLTINTGNYNVEQTLGMVMASIHDK